MKSKKFILKKVVWNTPIDKEEGTPIKNAATPQKITAFLRSTPKLSIRYAAGLSNKEIEEVIAANSTSKKNNAPKTNPTGIESNTAGNVMKINPGPAVGSNPNANTAGKIANPANKAASVSKVGIINALLSKSLSLER